MISEVSRATSSAVTLPMAALFRLASLTGSAVPGFGGRKALVLLGPNGPLPTSIHANLESQQNPVLDGMVRK